MIRVALIITLTAALVLLIAGLVLDVFTEEWELGRTLMAIGSTAAAVAAFVVLLVYHSGGML